jgi:molybdopterin molybdotransferase
MGEVRAGDVYRGDLLPRTAVRIMTGAPLPAGADSVIEVEETEVNGETVLARLALAPGRNVRTAGTDIGAGELALKAGTYLGPAQIALLAALGVSHPPCVARPRVAVVATGDELVGVETEPGPGQVVEVAGPALGAALLQVGSESVLVPRAHDTADDVERALREAALADVIITVGGVSMGEYDLVREVAQRLGELDFWRVAMRPGKPLAHGAVLGRPFIGLPGNPVSALVGFEVFVLPLLMAMSGRAGWKRQEVEAELAFPLSTPAGLRTFARARLESRPGRRPLAHPATGQASYQLLALATSNALLDIPETAAHLEAGAATIAIRIDQPPSPP